MKAVTHNGRCHADDLFAAAALQLKFGESIEILRARDEAQIAAADIVFDVGHVYSPRDRRFDHHQPGGAGTRENGIPYAAFGIVWKEFGEDICGSAAVAAEVDSRLAQPIDATDNGFTISVPKPDKPSEFVFDSIARAFCPSWLEDETGHDAAFFEALPFARRILERVIAHAAAKVKGNELAAADYAKSADPRLLVLEGPYPSGAVTKAHPEILFSVSPDVFAGRWNLRTVQDAEYVNRKPLPEAWAGLRGAELEAATGVPGASFCHRGRWFCAATTREAALALAALALAD
jgi:uncharacterized UPF0160 family protein